MNSITIKFGSVGLMFYLGLGMLYHLVSSDIPFTWADPWLYITMAIWPIFFIAWILAIFFICFISYVTYDVFFKDAAKKRQNKKRIETRKIESEERRRAAAKATPSESD